MALRIRLAGLSDVGPVRRRNEDTLALDPLGGILAVADGMGGHPGGDVASRTACAHAVERLRASGIASTLHDTTPDPATAMLETVVGAHEAVRARSGEDPALAGMGTTLTILAADVDAHRWIVGHVGDSRAYLLRHGSLERLTRDDTWVQQRVDADQLTPKQARRHPFGHILTQCLGLDEVPVPQVMTGALQPGDVFLLCTDGLTGALDDEILADALRAHIHGPGAPADIEGAARALVSRALEREAADNVTVGLLAVS